MAAEGAFAPRTIPIPCPQCGKQTVFVELSHEVAHFGRTILTSIDCKACGFSLHDIIPADFKAPSAFSIEIRKPKDLETKVIRSSSGTLKVSKLGITIEPGSAADGFISNIEGVLDRVQSALNAILHTPDDPARKAAEKKMAQLQRARAGKLAFKVELLDPHGNSALIGPRVKQRKLSAAQVKKLKTGLMVMELRPRRKVN